MNKNNYVLNTIHYISIYFLSRIKTILLIEGFDHHSKIQQIYNIPLILLYTKFMR